MHVTGDEIMKIVMLIILLTLSFSLKADSETKYSPSSRDYIKDSEFIAEGRVEKISEVRSSNGSCVKFQLEFKTTNSIKGEVQEKPINIGFNDITNIKVGDNVLVIFNERPRIFFNICPSDNFSGKFLGSHPYEPVYKIINDRNNFTSVSCKANAVFIFEQKFSVENIDGCRIMKGRYDVLKNLIVNNIK
jgi:hypothetical protein